MFGAKMPGPGGFTFGGPPTTSVTATGGFNLAGAAAQAGQHVAFGTTGQNPATSGTTSFNFGNTPGSTAPAGQGGFKLGATTPAFPSSQPAAPTTGFTLAGTTTQSGGLKLGTATPTPAFPGTNTASVAPTVGFSLPFTSNTTGGLGGLTGGVRPTLTSTASTAGGFTGFNNPANKPTTGLLGTSTASGGIFGTQATTSQGLGATTASGGIFGTQATTSQGLGATTASGGIFGTQATTTQTVGLGTTTAPGSIFGAPTTTSQTVGLGGVDPKTSNALTGGSATDPKAGDGKTLKKSHLPPEIMKTVEDFKTFVKDEKTVQEGISRMSSNPMHKVQEDVVSLKQLLSIVSNGLQRNACAVEKLKKEMTQELKNAEMAQRTKDIPAGLQYENTAPTEYFQRLVENFETQMLTYRQQIETLEGHLHSISQPSVLSPEELIDLLRKLHETFIALAAQLHQVHEAVKTQKELYLNYRKIFLHDTKNIFEREKKPVKPKVLVDHFGPSPFSGLSNAAAVAMATALTKSQQPTAAPPVGGLGTLVQPAGGFGTTRLLGAPTTTAPAFGFGLGTTTTTASAFGGFGTPSTTTPSLFGTPQPGQTTPAFGTPQLFPSAGGEQPFQLNKPPGTKRNKR
ncbi:nucleoporin p58/p45-like isoform X2 [Ostrea edulis]|uniref:nucleoporin p58/p45-like isoform X2 n=1 Tax=Ostrea edulis TaxID=37623 RepID=UPI0020950AE5|nr:nucleoporin p58/p45-like isoform X2 [Ostrea edulis]